MAWGVRWYLVGSIVLGLLGALAGCSGGGFFAERAPWRHEAEVQCTNTGAVKEGAGIVRIRPIHGPGVCGAMDRPDADDARAFLDGARVDALHLSLVAPRRALGKKTAAAAPR